MTSVPVWVTSRPRPSLTRHIRLGFDFISTGNPGWAAYDTTSRTTGLLTSHINAVDDPSGDERTLWNGIR